MLISDIAVSAGIQIIVGIGLQTLEFNTTVAEIHNGCVYAEPIFQQEKMLGFGTKGLVLSLVVTDAEAGRAWQFSNIKIRNIKTSEDKLFHEISCKTEGRALNRRGACRVWLGEPGVAMVGKASKPFDVTIKDISLTGIAFICSADEEVPMGSVVHLTFMDEELKAKFDLSAIVVRCFDMERARMLYGCKLNHESNALGKYINEKQREKLRAARYSKVVSVQETENKKRR